MILIFHCIWRRSHIFKILWTGFHKERSSTPHGGMLECAVTLGVIMQNSKYRDVWRLLVQEGVMLGCLGPQHRQVHRPCQVLFGSTVAARALGSSAMPLGPAARGQHGQK